MPEELMAAQAAASGASAMAPALAFLVGAYFFAVWDGRREGVAADGQIGLKVVLYALAISALTVALAGAEEILQYLLRGAKGGSGPIKSGAAGLVSGGLILGGIVMAMLPRTNTEEHPKVFRIALGFVAAIAGATAVVDFSGFVNLMINGSGKVWAQKSAPMGSFLVHGGVAFLALNKLGSLSGWTAPARPVMQAGMPQQGYPPQQSGGMQQAGYPPQQGYPPQGGMPPQGAPQGGYPPQGGMPPQGGGYPPQGGGGYQPR